MLTNYTGFQWLIILLLYVFRLRNHMWNSHYISVHIAHCTLMFPASSSHLLIIRIQVFRFSYSVLLIFWPSGFVQCLANAPVLTFHLLHSCSRWLIPNKSAPTRTVTHITLKFEAAHSSDTAEQTLYLTQCKNCKHCHLFCTQKHTHTPVFNKWSELILSCLWWEWRFGGSFQEALYKIKLHTQNNNK